MDAYAHNVRKTFENITISISINKYIYLYIHICMYNTLYRYSLHRMFARITFIHVIACTMCVMPEWKINWCTTWMLSGRVDSEIRDYLVCACIFVCLKLLFWWSMHIRNVSNKIVSKKNVYVYLICCSWFCCWTKMNVEYYERINANWCCVHFILYMNTHWADSFSTVNTTLWFVLPYAQRTRTLVLNVALVQDERKRMKYDQNELTTNQRGYMYIFIYIRYVRTYVRMYVCMYI